MNKAIMKTAGFGKEVEQIEAGNCPFCKNKIDMNSFRDKLSIKEFGISGLCQQCQDTFGGE
jgi:hypothetical protein